MQKPLQKILMLMGLSVLLSFQLGCGNEADGSGSSDDSSLLPEVGSVESGSFYLDIDDDSTNWTHLLHKSTGITDSCSIDADTTSNEFIDCELHVQEGTSYAQAIKIRQNVPAGMCRYFTFSNYWYYNFQPGFGPTTVQFREVQNAAGDTLRYECATSNAGEGALETCTTANKTEVFENDGNPACIYNHSLNDDDHPNCCIGNYTLTTEVYDEDNTTVTDTTTTESSWGDSFDPMCFGGTLDNHTDPDNFGVSGWPYSALGYPVSLHTSDVFSDGFSRNYGLFPTIDKAVLSYNVGTANFFTAATHAATSNMPMAFSGGSVANGAGQDESGDAMAEGNAQYRFECRDEGYEVIHRIDLYVQEWNTAEEYANYLAGSAADPDVTGTEGTNCDYQNGGGNCNDLGDWDDNPGFFYPEETW